MNRTLLERPTTGLVTPAPPRFLLAIALLVGSPGMIATGAETKLPGALPEIRAAQYPSLQAAFDAVPDGGGLVRLPAGTFEISEPLVLRSGDVAVVGAGSATNIVNGNQDGRPALVIAHPDHARTGNDRRKELWRVRLADFRITGNEKSGAGIVAHNINEIFIDGMTVSYHGGAGIHLDHCYEDPRITDSLLTYNKAEGVRLDGCHDIVVSATQFEENLDALRCADGFNLCMTGCNLDDHLRYGVVIENTYGSIVSANMIEECRSTAVVLDRDCYGTTVSANVIAHNGGGVDLRDAHGCAISANTFTIQGKDALRIGPGSGRIAVSGNSFSNSYIGEGRVKRQPDDRIAAGVVIDSANGVLFTGNLLSGIDAPAAVVKPGGEAPSLVSENLFIDSPTDLPVERRKESVIERNLASPAR